MSLAAPRIRKKWRPRLSHLLIFLLTGVLLSPLASVVLFRIYENQLVVRTEAELIAQSAALAADVRREAMHALSSNAPLGAAVDARENAGKRGVADGVADNDAVYAPLTPQLDLATEEIQSARPAPLPAPVAANPDYIRLGEATREDFIQTQRLTLTGFRLLDPNGVVIAGREETGLSLAHIPEVAAALSGRYASVLRERHSHHPPPPLSSLSRGTSIRIFAATPIILRDHVIGVIYASRTPPSILKNLYAEWRKIALAALFTISVTLLTGFLFLRVITRPLRALLMRAQAIRMGDRNAIRPLDHHGTAELAALAQGFFDMAAALANRSDFIETFAAHTFHELKSPLSSIQGAAEILLDELNAPSALMTPETHKRFLENILGDAQRLSAIAQRLREFARAESSPLSGATDLASLARALQTAFPKLKIKIDEKDGAARLAISQENAVLALSHLAENALQHGADCLTLTPGIRNERFILRVEDNGRGISPNNSSRVFDSFFTTRRETGGTGMGLAIARAMLRAHGGEIALMQENDARNASGAVFEIILPIGDESKKA